MKRVAARLCERYGRGYSSRNLFRMMKFAQLYPDAEILSAVATILSWSQISELLTIDEQPRRDFYVVMCARETWSVRTLRTKIDDKLYERTVAARGTSEGIDLELAALRAGGRMTPALAFRDPYVLDFLGLDPKHSESDLEQAILDEMQRLGLGGPTSCGISDP